MGIKGNSLTAGIMLLCLGVHIIITPRGSNYFTLSFLCSVVLITAATAVLTARESIMRRYFLLAYPVLWVGIFFLFKEIPFLARHGATLFFLCLSIAFLTINTRIIRFIKPTEGALMKLLGAGFAAIALLCINNLWFLRLFADYFHVVLALALIGGAFAVFYINVK